MDMASPPLGEMEPDRRRCFDLVLCNVQFITIILLCQIKKSALRLTFFVLAVFHDIAHLAMENFAEYFYRVRADAFVALQPCDLPGADMILMDQRILRNAAIVHDRP